MKTEFFKVSFKVVSVLLGLIFIINCSSDDAAESRAILSDILVTGSIIPFGSVDALSHSDSQSIQIKGSNLLSDVSVSVTENFQLSLDDSSFSSQLTIDKDEVNMADQILYVRFSPAAMALGSVAGELTIASGSVTPQTMTLTGTALSIAPIIAVNSNAIVFEDTQVSQSSESNEVVVVADNLDDSISVTVSAGFEISIDGVDFVSSIEIPVETANAENTIYVRFLPTEVGNVSGTLIFSSDGASSVEVSLSGNGTPVVYNYVTFDSERLAFGGGYNQSSTQMFNLHDDLSNIETIKMYVKLRCPSVGCDEWDVYANVKVRDNASGELYELGRYITPYWNDNSQLERGFEFDVTDFKSLLTGTAELRIRTECWNDKGYEVTVDFDYIEGTPDYPYYAVSRVLAYDDWSSSGVPYGVDNSFDLDKSVSVPSNAESTHLRTIISGWGHATPNDPDGRPCAEWCYRTHDVLINGTATFQHDLAPLGCASNPVSNQAPGNWQPDRAGWCPGMVVPARIDQFSSAMGGNMFTFEYDYEDWVNDGENGNAFYATSTFVVVKSNTPINKPVVNE